MDTIENKYFCSRSFFTLAQLSYSDFMLQMLIDHSDEEVCEKKIKWYMYMISIKEIFL
jgi:hypothetical protein